MENKLEWIGYAGLVGLILAVFALFFFIARDLSKDSPYRSDCEKADFYILEVKNGQDKPMGFDYERAKELAAGRGLYVTRICKD